MKLDNKYVIAVVGPTAIGKTALSIKLAQHFNTEIISADSRQFYEEMRIGTAVPTDEELSAAKHHFIQHISIDEDYNVGIFEKEAIDKLEELFRDHDVVILVGGSGLYVDAVVNGLDDFPKVDPKIRESLNARYHENGLLGLQKELKTLDEEAYNSSAIENPHRIIRALEICIGTGKPYSSFLSKKNKKRAFKTIYIGLEAAREIIYERINTRVDVMMQEGLLEEVISLNNKKHLNSLNTVGYKELFKHINEDWSLDFAVSEIKKNTRRFAKRQLTWYRKNTSILWFNYKQDSNTIIQRINDQLL